MWTCSANGRKQPPNKPAAIDFEAELDRIAAIEHRPAPQPRARAGGQETSERLLGAGEKSRQPQVRVAVRRVIRDMSVANPLWGAPRALLNGIFWVLRSSAPWRGLPENYGPRTTCYNSLRSPTSFVPPRERGRISLPSDLESASRTSIPFEYLNESTFGHSNFGQLCCKTGIPSRKPSFNCLGWP